MSAEDLERRIYARLDESLAPVNEAIDVLVLRIDRLAEDYESLHESIARNDLDFGALKTRLEMQGQYQVSLAERLNDIGDLGLEPLGQKFEELTHALEDHVHKASGETMLAATDFHTQRTEGTAAPQVREMLSTLRNEIAPDDAPWARSIPVADEYEVDGHPATKAEYEAAERDDKAPHTTRHVHRPFSDGAKEAEPVRNFLWAVQQMKEGVKMRCSFWAHGAYCRFNSGRILRLKCVVNEESQPNFTPEDLLATDWEIAP